MWKEILNILEIKPGDENKGWNPKSFKLVEKKKSALTELLGDEKKAEEIVNMAMIGELSIMKNEYPY